MKGNMNKGRGSSMFWTGKQYYIDIIIKRGNICATCITDKVYKFRLHV